MSVTDELNAIIAENGGSVRDALNVTLAKLNYVNARLDAAEARAERYEEALHRIDVWANAYPLDIFPEPDFKRVREVLEAAGITLDSVSASNMRHVLNGVARIVENAMKGGEG